MDLGLLSFFGSLFTFILVWIIVYALLEHTKALGEGKKGLNGLIGIAVAVLVLASKYALSFINFIVPWFLILAVAVFLIIFVFRIFGIGTESIIAGGKSATMWVIFFSVIILLFGFGSVFGQITLNKGDEGNQSTSTGDDTSADGSGDLDTGPVDTEDYTKNVYNTLFHPKILGLALIFLIGVIALVFLTSKG